MQFGTVLPDFGTHRFGRPHTGCESGVNKLPTTGENNARSQEIAPEQPVNKANNFSTICRAQGTPAAENRTMRRDGNDVGTREQTPEVFLDGVRLTPPRKRMSLAGSRAWLEALAMRQGRVLSMIQVDGEPLGLGRIPASHRSFRRIDAETTRLEAMPLQVLSTALEQTNHLLARTEAALARMCINGAAGARQIWWELVPELKLPLVTLSLLPPAATHAPGPVSLQQLRRWQLEQLAGLIAELDRCATEADAAALVEAIERRLWPWLCRLRETILLMHQSFAGDSSEPRHASPPVSPQDRLGSA